MAKSKIRWNGTTEDNRTTSIVWGGYTPCWYPNNYTDCVIEDMYFEDFDVTGEFGTLDASDAVHWNESVGRTDIYNYLVEGGTELGPGPRIVYINLSYQAGEDTFRAPKTTYTWSDVQLTAEIAEILGGSSSRRKREEQLRKLDKDKKKKLIHLICRVKGEKVYDEKKEVGDIQIKLEDAELVIERVLGKIKVEKVDVL
jgi:hypothetical protein